MPAQNSAHTKIEEDKASRGAGQAGGEFGRLPPELLAKLTPPMPVRTDSDCRRALVRLGYCDGARPAVSLELFGGLRLKSGCRMLPMHAGTIGEALEVLSRVYPKAGRLLPRPEELGRHYRFSVNGTDVTTDLAYPLGENDQLILFSASVGG